MMKLVVEMVVWGDGVLLVEIWVVGSVGPMVHSPFFI